MPVLKSYKSKGAIAPESTYGVHSTTQADYKVLRLVSENIMPMPEYIRSNAKFGVNGRLSSQIEAFKYAGNIVIELDYVDALPVLKAFMGAGASDVTTETDTPSAGYTKYTIQLSEEVAQSFSILLDKGGEGAYVYEGGKVNTGTFTITAGQIAQLELETVYKDRSSPGGSPVISIPQLTEVDLMVLADTVFRVKAGADQTPSGSDEYKISNYQIANNWNLLQDALVSGGTILEPIPSNAKEVSCTVENPMFDSDDTQLQAMRNAKLNDTPVTHDIKLTTQEAGNDYASLMFHIPRSKSIEGFEPETADEIIGVSGTLEPYRKAENDTADDKEFYCEYIVKD